MTITHRLTGYDRRTDRLVLAHAIPVPELPMARRLAAVPPTDADAAGVYALEDDQARRLAAGLDLVLDTDRYAWCLEPMPQPLEAAMP